MLGQFCCVVQSAFSCKHPWCQSLRTSQPKLDAIPSFKHLQADSKKEILVSVLPYLGEIWELGSIYTQATWRAPHLKCSGLLLIRPCKSRSQSVSELFSWNVPFHKINMSLGKYGILLKQQVIYFYMEKLKQYLLYYSPQDACTETVQLITKPRQATGRKVHSWRSQLQHPPCYASVQPLVQDLTLARNSVSGCSHVCGRPWTNLQVHLVIFPQVWYIRGKVLRKVSWKSSSNKQTNNQTTKKQQQKTPTKKNPHQH